MPLIRIADTQHAGAGVDLHLPVGPGRRQIQFDVRVQLTPAGEIPGQVVGQDCRAKSRSR